MRRLFCRCAALARALYSCPFRALRKAVRKPLFCKNSPLNCCSLANTHCFTARPRYAFPRRDGGVFGKKKTRASVKMQGWKPGRTATTCGKPIFLTPTDSEKISSGGGALPPTSRKGTAWEARERFAQGHMRATAPGTPTIRPYSRHALHRWNRGFTGPVRVLIRSLRFWTGLCSLRASGARHWLKAPSRPQMRRFKYDFLTRA